MRHSYRLLVSVLPLSVAAGLLYAGLFVKPDATGPAVQAPPIERRDRLYGLTVVESDYVWVAGSDGKIRYARDPRTSGTWTVQNSGVAANLQAIDAWDARRAVAVGNDGVVIVTGDGGAAWTPSVAPVLAVANKLTRVRALADGGAYAVGEYNAILRTQDFGRTWERLTPEEDVAWYGFDSNAGRLLVVGEFGRIHSSFDAGRNWKQIQTPAKAHLTAVAFRSDVEAVAVGLNGTVVRTDDGSRTWSLVDTGIEEHIYDVIWDQTRYVACGERGLLIESPDGMHWSPLESTTRFERSSFWFTQIRKFQSGYLVAGSTVGLLDGGRFRDLSNPSRSALALTPTDR